MNSLRTVRESKKLTQKQVAEACNLSKSVYSRYESGERNPSIRAARALAKALDCSIDELLRDPEETDCPQVAA